MQRQDLLWLQRWDDYPCIWICQNSRRHAKGEKVSLHCYGRRYWLMCRRWGQRKTWFCGDGICASWITYAQITNWVLKSGYSRWLPLYRRWTRDEEICADHWTIVRLRFCWGLWSVCPIPHLHICLIVKVPVIILGAQHIPAFLQRLIGYEIYNILLICTVCVCRSGLLTSREWWQTAATTTQWITVCKLLVSTPERNIG